MAEKIEIAATIAKATKKQSAKKKPTPKNKKTAKPKKAVTPQGEPNIIFVGKRKFSNGKTELREAPAFVIGSIGRINLPADETQKKGFYLPPNEVSDLVRLFPESFKVFKPKGRK